MSFPAGGGVDAGCCDVPYVREAGAALREIRGSTALLLIAALSMILMIVIGAALLGAHPLVVYEAP